MYQVTVSSHAYHREFNDRLHQQDIESYIIKCVDMYTLNDHQISNGFYRFTDDDIVLVLKKDVIYDKLDFSCVTLYSKHDKYINLNINPYDFRCYFEGTTSEERLKERVYKQQSTKRNFKGVTSSLAKSFNMSIVQLFPNIVTTSHEVHLASAVITQKYKDAFYVIKPALGERSNKTVYIMSDRKILKIMSEREYMLEIKPTRKLNIKAKK